MQVLYVEDYRDVSVNGGYQTASNGDREAIIHEILLYVRLSETNLSGDVPEMGGYLRGRTVL